MSRMPGSLKAVSVAVLGLITTVGYAQNGPGPQCAQVRADIAKLRADARAQIRAVLTPEQQAKFDALPMLQGPRGMGMGRGPCAGGAPGAAGANAPHWFLDRMTQKLNLTDAEKASIQPILDQARSARQARHEQARTAFRALLTPEQAAKLDELKAESGFDKFAQRGELQLTDEQKAKAHEIFASLRTDLQQMRTDTHQQIRAQLTPEQQTQFDALQPAGGWGGKQGMAGGMGRCGGKRGMAGGTGRWGGKHGMAGGPALGKPGMVLDRLSSALSLTDAQRTSVKGILDNLHTAVRARIQEARTAAGTPAT